MVQIKASGEFVFKGNGWTKHLKDYAKRVHLQIYSKWVEIFNSHIAEFNMEFDDKNPGISMIEDNSPEWFMYNKFISDKMYPYNEAFNAANLDHSIFQVGTDPKTAMFILKLKDDPNTYEYLDLVFDN